jgi:SAM-dependent methyltransferase
LVEQGTGGRLLDFGCGDGRFLEKLATHWHIDAYDPSEMMRTIARRRVGSRLERLVATTAELKGPYDVILLGMVILVLPTPQEVYETLHQCARRMHQTSRLIITTTHPCFRTFNFSNFSTSFGRIQPFKYLGDGTPFEVTLRDPGTRGITFTDYHWSLSFTFGALRAAGLVVTSIIEVPDDEESPESNPSVPPFLIFECRRSM